MSKYIILIMLIIPNIGYSRDFKVIELDEIRVDYMKFADGGRDPALTNGTDRELGMLLDLNVHTTLFKYGYWRTLVHSYTTNYADTHKPDQFKLIGLNMELGVRVTNWLDIYYSHYSQHLLDMPSEAIGGYPMNDGVGIHLYIYSNQRKNSILNF
jgi:hypothetical protein